MCMCVCVAAVGTAADARCTEEEVVKASGRPAAGTSHITHTVCVRVSVWTEMGA